MSPVLGQRSFDDLGRPLHEVVFCVVDLETTGGSPIDDRITEVGAVKVRGGECLGTYQTLVDPGLPIPPQITVLTGITEAMVAPAPRIDAVLPSLLEFVGDAVLVGHNLRFDTSFLDAALVRTDRPRLSNRRVDTAALARRLVRDEVPNCRLGTLADRLRLSHRPSHRALDDALATADLLHTLLERAAGFGVFGLDDLIALPKLANHAQAKKLTLTTDLPRRPGVYRFRDANGAVLYVGKASDLRSRVRSYFSSDSRRKVGGLLREFASIDVDVCAHPLEAGALEIRQIHEHLPRYNRRSKSVSKYRYLKLTDEPYPRLSVVRDVRAGDGATHLGPLPSQRAAQRVAEAIQTAIPLRRCTEDPARSTRSAPCAAAQLGVSRCPCAGGVSIDEYAPIAEAARRVLAGHADVVLDHLAAKMHELAGAERFEEAADLRDRGHALGEAMRRHARVAALRRAGRVTITFAGGGAELHRGVLVTAWGDDAAPSLGLGHRDDEVPADERVPLPRHLVDEVLVNASWLDRRAASVGVVTSGAPLTLPMAGPNRFRSTG